MRVGVQRFFLSPHLVDLVLAFTILEAAVLIRLRPRRPGDHRSERPVVIVLMLLPGVCLMLAIRAALDDAAWPWVAVALVAALVAHAGDIRERWRR
jgi:hypothetical protein